MDEREVVTIFVRHDGEILLVRRSHPVGSYPGRWGTVAGTVESDPASAIERELREEIGRTDWTLVRRGETFVVRDEDRDVAWTVHSALIEVPDRTIDFDREHTIAEWVHPPEIRRSPTVPGLWRSYDRVRPTIETVATDETHGSREVSLRALGALRDAAAATGTTDGPADLVALLDRASDLATARPAMAAVTNRIDRAVSRGLASGSPTGIERAAIAVHDAVRDAHDAVAANASPWIDDRRLLTLSRSGTVLATLRAADPAGVIVARSEPGGEGVAVAETIARSGVSTTLVPDAAVASSLADVDTLLVGADAVAPDGTIVNKVGTRGGALAAAHEGVDVVVVTASDAVDPSGVDDAIPTVPEALPDVDVETRAPLFDRTPPDAIDRIVTESGALRPQDVERIADRLTGARAWRGDPADASDAT